MHQTQPQIPLPDGNGYPHSIPPSPSEIPDVFDRIAQILSETWTETGFGHLEIESERIKSDKIRVIVKGSTYYRFVLSEQDVKTWKANSLNT
jgi:hypothetical protein